MIATLLLLALAAPAPADAAATATASAPALEVAVLVMRSGAMVEVRSYRVDGPMLRAVGTDDVPLVMRATLVDLEASAAATATHRDATATRDAAKAKVRAALERHQAAVRAARDRREPTLLRAAEWAAAHGRRPGSMSTVGSESPAGAYADAPEVGVEVTVTQPGSAPVTARTGAGAVSTDKDEAAWRAQFKALRDRYRVLMREHKRLADELERTVYVWTEQYGSAKVTTWDPGAAAKYGQMSAELSAVSGQIEIVRAEHAALREEARRAGVVAAVWRDRL